MAEPVLIVEDLTVVLHRDGHPNIVLDEVGFAVAPGEILAIVGESGSGKSTIGLAIQGLLPRQHRPQLNGSIRLAGEEVIGGRPDRLRALRRSQVRAISQDPMGALNPTMSIRNQMQESMDGSEASRLDWLERTGLADPERIAASLPHHLSGGQCQRVLIAMAMMAGPKLIIADEPTTALDVATQFQILELLRRLVREQGTAVVFVTHDLSVAAHFADRLAVLHAGRLVEIGRIGDVIANPSHPFTAGLLAVRFDLATARDRPLPTLPPGRADAAPNGTGCNYLARCAIAGADCRTTRPSLQRALTHSGHAACLHPEQVSSLGRHEASPHWPRGSVDRHEVALKLTGITKCYRIGTRNFWGVRSPRPILRSVSLEIGRNECVALLGQSGAGKSTLLRVAAGLLSPDEGSVLRTDASPQVIFQDAVASLTPWLTIGEQVGERLRARNMTARERRRRVAEAFDLVNLDAALIEALPAELSVGQCQRAVVARAVVVPPKLLLCDEPVSAMDVSLAAATLNLLGDLRRRLDMAMLFVTHDLAAARIIADRIAILKDGELVADGDPDELAQAAHMPVMRALIASQPRLHAGLDL